MRRIAANFAFDGNNWIEKPLLLLDENGLILKIDTFSPAKSEPAQTEFYNGMLVPGFINAHTHLELSYSNLNWQEKTGIPGFIEHVRNIRRTRGRADKSQIRKAIRKMKNSGTVGLVDVVNSGESLELLHNSGMRVMGMMEYIALSSLKIRDQHKHFMSLKTCYPEIQFVNALHSPYALTTDNFNLLKSIFADEQFIAGLHFLESADELDLYQGKGRLLELYRQIEPAYESVLPGNVPIRELMHFFAGAKQVLFVHNTFITREEAESIKNMSKQSRQKPGFVLCPRSNQNISNSLPPFDILRETGLPIMLGTDSLLSAQSLSVFDELMNVHELRNDIPLDELLQWITKNPADMMKWDDKLGSLEAGKTPGVNLIEGGRPDGIPPGANLNVII
jgi:cytosine/adenosine deaminase-related metal-dependent hydrolase